jgi:hypothetical protein
MPTSPRTTFCPRGVLTKVAWGPLFFGQKEFLISARTNVHWERYTDAPPFKMTGDVPAVGLHVGDTFTGGMFRLSITIYNPSVFNEWWFLPSTDVTMALP